MNNVAKYLCIVREKKERKQTIEKNKIEYEIFEYEITIYS